MKSRSSSGEAGEFFGPSMWLIREGIRKMAGRLGWREGRCARCSINEVPAIRRGVMVSLQEPQIREFWEMQL